MYIINFKLVVLCKHTNVIYVNMVMERVVIQGKIYKTFCKEG